MQSYHNIIISSFITSIENDRRYHEMIGSDTAPLDISSYCQKFYSIRARYKRCYSFLSSRPYKFLYLARLLFPSHRLIYRES